MNTDKKLPTYFQYMYVLYRRDLKTNTLYYLECDKWYISSNSFHFHSINDTSLTYHQARRKFPAAFPLKDKLPKHIEA